MQRRRGGDGAEEFIPMTTLLYSHSACLNHDTGRGHPERIARLEVILNALAAPEFHSLPRREAPEATRDQIALAHDRGYVDELLAAVPKSGFVRADMDTVMSPGSGAAALRAAGAVVAAVDAVIGGEAGNAFCAVRPPGHHAEANRSMGFCLFNNVAIGAHHARAAHGLRRIAVVDFDVHHGNGTQHMFESDSDLFYGSTHQWPLYPGTGARSETGVGNICNVPLFPGAGSEQFRAAFDGVLLPALRRFAPELLLISAGFDAHRRDPLAGLELETEDFAWATAELMAVARQTCGGRLVSTLEGGYDLEALADSAAAHVRTLMS
jgi:acetoin utilization deacetylase AcuC-like enzyme